MQFWRASEWGPQAERIRLGVKERTKPRQYRRGAGAPEPTKQKCAKNHQTSKLLARLVVWWWRNGSGMLK